MKKIIKLMMLSLVIITGLFNTKINAQIPEFRKMMGDENGRTPLTVDNSLERGLIRKNFNGVSIPAYEVSNQSWVSRQERFLSKPFGFGVDINGRDKKGVTYDFIDLDGAVVQFFDDNGIQKPIIEYERRVGATATFKSLIPLTQINGRDVVQHVRYKVAVLDPNPSKRPHIRTFDKSNVMNLNGALFDVKISYHYLDTGEKAPFPFRHAFLGLSKEDTDTEALQVLKGSRILISHYDFDLYGPIGRGHLSNENAFRVPANVGHQNFDLLVEPLNDEVEVRVLMSGMDFAIRQYSLHILYSQQNGIYGPEYNHIPYNPVKYWATKDDGFTTRRGNIENIVVSQRFLHNPSDAKRKVNRFTIIDDVSTDVEVLSSKVYKVNRNKEVTDISNQFDIRTVTQDSKKQIHANAKSSFLSEDANYDGSDIVLYHTVKILKQSSQVETINMKSAVSIFDDLTLNPTATPTARFIPDTFTITTQIDNGTITPSDNNVVYGSDREISFDLSTGYELAAAKVNDVLVTPVGNRISLSNITENKNVVVTTRLKTYNITTNIDDGTITPSHTKEHGSSSTITFTPPNNKLISTVSVNGIPQNSTDSPLIIPNITENKTVDITTELKKFTITTQIDNGTITPNENDVVYGSDREISFDLVTGYELEAAKVNDVPVTPVGNRISLSNITENKNVVVTTRLKTYNITTNIDDGTITPSHTKEHGSSSTITFTPPNNKLISTVSVNGIPQNSTDSPLIIPNITENKTVDITTELKKFNITTQIDNGTITPSDNNVVYGSDREISFVVKKGYKLVEALVNDKTVEIKDNKVILNDITENKDVVIKTRRNIFNVTTEINYGTIDNSFEIEENKPFTVNFYPPTSYRVHQVFVNGKEYNHQYRTFVDISGISEDTHIKVVMLPPLVVKKELPETGNSIMVDILGCVSIVIGFIFIFISIFKRKDIL